MSGMTRALRILCGQPHTRIGRGNVLVRCTAARSLKVSTALQSVAPISIVHSRFSRYQSSWKHEDPRPADYATRYQTRGLSRKQSATLADTLSECLDGNDENAAWHKVSLLIDMRKLDQLTPDLQYRVFRCFYDANSPHLEEYVRALLESSQMHRCFREAMPGFWQQDMRVKQTGAIIYYRQLRDGDTGEPGDAEQQTIRRLVAAQMLYDYCGALSREDLHCLGKDFLALLPRLRGALIEPLLRVFNTVELSGLGWFVQQACHVGWNKVAQLQEQELQQLIIEKYFAIGPAMACFQSLVDADRRPPFNVRLELASRAIKAPKDEEVLSHTMLPRLLSPEEFCQAMEQDPQAFRPGNLCRVLVNLSSERQFEAAEQIYNALDASGLTDIIIQSGYFSCLRRSGDIGGAEAIIHDMLTRAFHRQEDGRYAGPNGERLMVVDMSNPEWRADTNDMAQLFAPYVEAHSSYTGPAAKDERTAKPQRDVHVKRVRANIHCRGLPQQTDSPVLIVKPITLAAFSMLGDYRKLNEYDRAQDLLMALFKRGCVEPQLLEVAMGLASSADHSTRILELHTFLCHIDMPPSRAFYQAVIPLLLKKGDLELARQHLERMLKYTKIGVFQGSKHFRTAHYVDSVAEAYALCGDIDAVKEIINMSLAQEVPLVSRITDNLLIAAARQPTDDALVSSILYITTELKVPLSDHSHSIIMVYYGRSKQRNQLESWYERGIQAGYMKRFPFMTAAIYAFSVGGYGQRSSEIFEDLHMQPRFWMTNTLLSVRCDWAGRNLPRGQLMPLWRHHTNAHIAPNQQNYVLLAEAALRQEDYKLAEDVLLRMMPAAGLVPYLPLMAQLFRTAEEQRIFRYREVHQRLLDAMRRHYHTGPASEDFSAKIREATIETSLFP